MSAIDEQISRWIRPEIRSIAAYHVPEPADVIKLDAMENPYVLPEELRQAWLDELAQAPINRYPDAAARDLSAVLRKEMGVPEGMGMLLGNGSDEIIQMLALAMGGPKRCVMAPEPGFVMYRMIATFAGLEYVGVPLGEGFALDRAAMIQGIEEYNPAIIYIAYPNNPTGNLFDDADIEAIIREAQGVVVLDEAYHAFAQRSWMERLGEFDNLLVMRTVSKLGLAGLRLGLLAGPTAWIEQFDKVRLPYNINVLTQKSAEFALRHHEVFDEQTRLIREERESLAAELTAMEQLQVFPSAANFILFRTPAGRADGIFDAIRQQGVLIKNLSPVGGPLKDCLRVTVGKPEENRAFLDALKQAL